MKHDRAKWDVVTDTDWRRWGCSLQTQPDGVQRWVATTQRPTATPTHGQVLVYLDDLRVERHLLQPRRRLVYQRFHLEAYVQQHNINSAFQPSWVGKSLWLELWQGVFTCVGRQITRCDSICQLKLGRSKVRLLWRAIPCPIFDLIAPCSLMATSTASTSYTIPVMMHFSKFSSSFFMMCPKNLSFLPITELHNFLPPPSSKMSSFRLLADHGLRITRL